MPGNAKAWNKFADTQKLKDLDKKEAEIAKRKTGSVADAVSVGAGVKTVKKYKTERHQLMDEIFRGQ